jgi:hypothetical protein
VQAAGRGGTRLPLGRWLNVLSAAPLAKRRRQPPPGGLHRADLRGQPTAHRSSSVSLGGRVPSALRICVRWYLIARDVHEYCSSQARLSVTMCARHNPTEVADRASSVTTSLATPRLATSIAAVTYGRSAGNRCRSSTTITSAGV